MKRRTFIQSMAGTGVAAVTVTTDAVALRPTRVIDTHTHFYDPSRPQGVPWPPKDSKLYRTVLPSDWAAVAAPQGVGETIVVEASPWVEDNQWVLDLAAQDARLLGLVGNLDPNDEAFERHVKRFAANPKFRGVRWRSGLVDIDQNPERVLAGARVLAEHDLELDLNGGNAMLPHARVLARQVPTLRIVINHVGGAGDPAKLGEEWKQAVTALAQEPNVFMKVSGMVEQVRGAEGESPRQLEYYLPILDQLWNAFGADRLVYGSNWPVSDRGAPYEVVYALVRDYFSGKGGEAVEKFFWRNACVAYGVV